MEFLPSKFGVGANIVFISRECMAAIVMYALALSRIYARDFVGFVDYTEQRHKGLLQEFLYVHRN